MISDNIVEIYQYIESHGVKNRLELYGSLCEVMGKSLPPQNIVSALFQSFMRDIYEIKDLYAFLNFIEILLDFISKNYDSQIRNQFLNGILKRFSEFFMSVDLADYDKNKEIINKLSAFLQNIVDSCENITEILALEPFLQFVTYLPTSMKKSVCRKILMIFAESDSKLTDPISVHTLLSLAKSLNEDYGFSLDDEEKETISRTVK
mmetsp:Transcript_18046/g.15763  ORF Transcript_18046/g.15763 Transcript_18046/m.15763 type:complete len:206 (-) Transcript_18046:1012-1629(-)